MFIIEVITALDTCNLINLLISKVRRNLSKCITELIIRCLL